MTPSVRLHRPVLPHFIQRLLGFLHRNPVLLTAFFAASVTACLVPPDSAYLGYFDLKTLSCLFCTLAVVCALRNIYFFRILAGKIVSVCGNLRLAVLSLVAITFFGSMLIANDMALITFLPLGYFVLSTTGNEKRMAFVFIMQNIAANLGGMVTPFGNPQNLFLYTKFGIPTGEFTAIMLPPFLCATALIALCCFVFVPSVPLRVGQPFDRKLPAGRCAAYLVLFALSIVIVFRVIPYWVGLIVIPASLLLLDPKALRDVDYGLLFTFVFFFIFAGNMGRIDAVREAFGLLLGKNTLLFGALSCQLISNVPSAVLLSQFTENYRALLLAVNIGGTGTLIASLASLITFREYSSHNPGKTKSYLLTFSALNFGFLALLLVFCAVFCL